MTYAELIEQVQATSDILHVDVSSFRVVMVPEDREVAGFVNGVRVNVDVRAIELHVS